MLNIASESAIGAFLAEANVLRASCGTNARGAHAGFGVMKGEQAVMLWACADLLGVQFSISVLLFLGQFSSSVYFPSGAHEPWGKE